MPVSFIRQHGDRITYSGRLKVTTCWCGIPHAVPEELYDFATREKNEAGERHAIYCPLGHAWVVGGESELDRTKRLLEREQRIATQRLERLEDARKETERERRSHAATKGHQTRLKNRIAAGVCPCCNRTFVNLGKHMAGQHPDFAVPTEKENDNGK